jgi:hypothetical protein
MSIESEDDAESLVDLRNSIINQYRAWQATGIMSMG